MERSLSPGLHVKPIAEPKARGRSLGARSLKEVFEMQKRLRLLCAVLHSDEKVHAVKRLHEEAEEENRQLRARLQHNLHWHKDEIMDLSMGSTIDHS